ncbi:MAG: hypothetical protein V4557_18030 [Bacteroidota bacterium]
MIQLLTSTALLALVQALIPNHWLPLIALAKSEKWARSTLETTTSISASAHVLGTLLLGIPFGLAGAKLSHEYEKDIHLTAPVFLIAFGMIYFFVNRVNKKNEEYNEKSSRSKKKWIIVFITMMLLSPCIEMHDLFIGAARYGFDIVLLLAMTYAVVSIAGIMVLVIFGSRMLRFLKIKYIERNQNEITAFVLILVGVMSFFIH